MMNAHCEKISKGKQGFRERELDHFGRDLRRLQLLLGKIKVIICCFVDHGHASLKKSSILSKGLGSNPHP